MKILLIHQYFKETDVTGGARFNEMTRIWREQGHEITVLAGDLDGQSSEKRSEYKGNFVTKKNQEGIEVYRCNVSESYNKNFLGRLWGYFSFVFSSTYAGLFKVKGKYDVILVTSPPLFVGITAYVLSVFKRTPFLFEIRDLWPESAIDTGVLKNKWIIKFAYWFEKFIYNKASVINVLTPAFYTKLVEDKKVSKSKVIEIPNAADFDMSDDLLKYFDYKEFRKEKGWENKFVITYVGAHGVANGLHQINETAKILKDTNVHFVLIGNGMKKEELKSQAAMMELTNITYLDAMPKKEVLKYVLAGDMGASVLIKNDTFKTVYSNKTFDYMSCKRPILMAIDGVSRELVEKADAGIFIEPENPSDFAEKIKMYMQNSELLLKQGENGYSFAKKNFDRNYLALKYLSELQKFDKHV
ncbi:glycosyltransferase family 4 protein [Myroides odoratimimus]|uniref:glycosyltransferase family 4 protein n=1 Tax=Myroides odoratimimus TaxID=76832 RepID=UPI002DB7FA94|nr:glycosyltransferase family 4 protein [Myroides odoratimimus]MEC4036379.1 glycosyltransferase family 4 protein [Myroides odoratimimus]